MEDIIGAPLVVEDAFMSLFDRSDPTLHSGDPTLQRRVVEIYICKLYQLYLVKGSICMQRHRSDLIDLWKFSEEHKPSTKEGFY
ncbi:Acetyl-CoA carboxylase 1 [Dendrobium catenatum]|uniref:Acetyl-CoA carboxylase 1 n=1 Tax=Dendrobium catenatum TaxID=906689 RepID=A0A2I0X220_9ASPA|nr:Acetyl-CoA carboxylase 1 [Dendrobium catenatum]